MIQMGGTIDHCYTEIGTLVAVVRVVVMVDVVIVYEKSQYYNQCHPYEMHD
jgi:hypothetical protein